jgi:hypothetical protein
MTKRRPLPRGQVPLDPEAAALLCRLAGQLGRPTSATLAGGPIEEVEAASHTAIPYEVLAVLAIEERSLHELVAITDEARAFYEATEPRLVRELGLDKVVLFARLAADPAEPRYAGFDKTTRRDHVSFVEWVLRKPGIGRRSWSLAGYLEARGSIAAGGTPAFTLAIEEPPKTVQYATHAKFGRGPVVSRADGKVVVEFADGRRTLAERFVVFESAAPPTTQ